MERLDFVVGVFTGVNIKSRGRKKTFAVVSWWEGRKLLAMFCVESRISCSGKVEVC